MVRIPPPQNPGTPSFKLPEPNRVIPSLNVAYEHSGSSDYSVARTELYRSNNAFVDGWLDRPRLPPTEYYQSSVVNDRRVTLTSAGSYYFRAIYGTFNQFRFTAPSDVNGVRTISRNRTFLVDPFALTEPESSSAGKDIYCPPEDWPCGRGGSTGGGSVPWYLRTTTHTAAMGPFFSTTSGSGGMTQGEIEGLLEGLSPAQLDGIADIVWEAYGEDVHDYFGADGGAASAQGGTGEPLRALMEPLAALDRDALWGPKRIALDRLLAVYDDYLAAGGGTSSAGKTGGAPAPAAFADVDAPGAGGAGLWPNPASTQLHVRLPEGGADVSVYDVAGRRIALLSAQTGTRATWDLRASGRRVAAGTYQIVVTARDGSRRTHTATVR